MTEALVEVADLRVRVKRREILRGVSFEVAQGEFLSIVGPNGAGKTTLLKCLTRIWPASSGAIRIAGKPLAGYSQRALARAIAYVPQANGRAAPFAVQEFVHLARYPYLRPFSAPGAADERAVQSALEATGMTAFADRPLATLSGGERQKALIAAALAQEAPVLLLDEATTFLDPRHQAEIQAILRKVNREAGAAVLSVTHDLNSAVLAGGRVLALKEGEAICCLRGREIMNNEILSRLYGKEFLFVEHPVTGERLIVPEGAP